MKTFKNFCLIIICLFSFLPIFSENNKHFSNYYFTTIDGEKGLSQNNVKSIIQDSWGFMWFGTRNRLNRYDGTSIKVFDCTDPVSKKSNNNISVLFEDKEKNLWIGTDKGVFIYNPVIETFTFFDKAAANGTQINNWVSDIQSDPDNNIWIVIPNQGVFRYNQDEKVLHHYTVVSKLIQSETNPQCICIEPNGKVWIGTNREGVYSYDENKDSFKQYLGDKNDDSLAGENIYKMCDYGDELIIGIHEGKLKKLNKRKNTLCDVNAPEVHYKIIRYVACYNTNELWVGTQSGLYIINELQRSVVHIQEDPMLPNSLSDNLIEMIYKDRENGIWIGTNFGGVNYLPDRGIKFDKYVPSSRKGSISSKRVRDIKEDASGKIWIGTEDAGLNVFDPETKQFGQIGKDFGKPMFYDKVISLLLEGNRVLAGFFKNGLDEIELTSYKSTHYTSEQLGLNEASIYALCEDRTGKIWIGNAWGVFVGDKNLKNFQRRDEFGFSFIYDIVEDAEGCIWVATMGNGVYQYNSSDRSIKHFLHDSENPQSLSSNSVSSITESSQGEIWFSTDRGGICRYNKKENHFTTFSTEEGLPDDVAYKILEDKHHNFWFGTNKGLVRFNPNTKNIRVFTLNDGLLSDQFNYKSALTSSSGTFYFGSLDGLIVFDPYQFKENSFVPPVFITGLTIFNKEVNSHTENSPLKKSIIHTNKITLQYDQSNIGFNFVSLSYIAPSANKYAYKMENIDKDWTYTSNNHSATYAKLPPGKYTFRVKGSNNDGLWNDNGTYIDIEILPPWWASKIAYVFYIINALGLLYLWFNWYKKKHEKRNLEKQKLFEIEKEKELYSAKVEFFTDIAHEVRTPLTLINGPLESMLEMDISDLEMKKNLRIMGQNTQQLLALINQLLDFRKVDSNKFSMSFSMLNISEILKETKDRFEPMAIKESKKITLNMPDTPVIAPVDKDGLTKILNNLFVNALKYSDKIIDIDLSTDSSYFTIRITNDGILIPHESREKIFDPFYQVKKEKNTASGSGIGLSLSRSLAGLHNGYLFFDAQSDLNTFILKLPLLQEKIIIPEKEKAPDDFIIEEANLKPEKQYTDIVLIVEDNLEMLSFISQKLKETFIVEQATNGLEALEILQNRNVDLIVSDVMMPGMDGFEFCARIKSDIEYSHIPVVLLTAKNDLSSKIQGLEMGADAYIEKPFSFNYLITQLTTLLNNRKREKEAFIRKPFLPVQQMGMNKADEQFMNKIIKIIQENITDNNFNVEKLSELVYMSRSSLHRKIKALSNLTPTDFIRLIRLRRAAEIILEGEYRVGEVCFLVGINSPSYFIKLFQKQFGMTPKEFEKQNTGSKG